MRFLKNENERKLGAALTLFGGACWGMSGSIGQYLFTAESMQSEWLVPVRLGLAGILLLAFSRIRYGRQVFAPWKNRTDAASLLIYGICGVSLCQFFYFSTIQYSSAAMATILQDLSPVMILIVTCMQEKRLPGIRELLCIVLALGGVFLLCTHGDPSHLTVPSRALLTGVLSAVCVTIYNVQPKKLLRRYPILILQGWAFLMGSVFFSVLFRIWTIRQVITAAGALGIAFVVLIGNILAFPCYMSGVRRIGPQKSILYGFSEPAVAAVITVTAFRQPIVPADIIGFLLIFLMIVLISAEPRQKPDIHCPADDIH